MSTAMLGRRREDEGAGLVRRWGDRAIGIRDMGAGDYCQGQDASTKPDSRVTGAAMAGGPLYANICTYYTYVV